MVGEPMKMPRTCSQVDETVPAARRSGLLRLGPARSGRKSGFDLTASHVDHRGPEVAWSFPASSRIWTRNGVEVRQRFIE